MKRHIKTTILIMITISVSLLSPYAFAESASLDGLIEEAVANNPGIQRAYHQWQAAEYKIKNVKSLPDPMMSYGYVVENIETRVGPQEQRYGVSQKIPFPGKLGLKGHAQKKHAQMFKEQYEAVKNELIKNVKFVYYDLFWVDKAIQVTEEEKKILENLEQVARRKYESNLTPQQDIIKAQIELTKLADKLYLLKQNRRSLTARMNSILNRNKNIAIQKIDNVDFKQFHASLPELIAAAAEARQELKASQLAVQRAQYEKSLAKMDFLPDFTFGVDYTEVGSGTTARDDDGKDSWVAMVSVNVPLWFDKNISQVREKNAELEAAQYQAHDMENTVVYEVEDLYFKIRAYQDIMSLYKTALIPQSDQAFDAARLGYESGEVDFLNWLDAQRNLLQTRLAYYKSTTDYLKSLAYLERVVGQSIFFDEQNQGGGK